MIPKERSVWDAKRNSSQVFPVSPDELPNAWRALVHLRSTDLALVKWIEDGHPHLTDAEHVERFGVPYKSHRAKREAVSPTRETGD